MTSKKHSARASGSQSSISFPATRPRRRSSVPTNTIEISLSDDDDEEKFPPKDNVASSKTSYPPSAHDREAGGASESLLPTTSTHSNVDMIGLGSSSAADARSRYGQRTARNWRRNLVFAGLAFVIVVVLFRRNSGDVKDLYLEKVDSWRAGFGLGSSPTTSSPSWTGGDSWRDENVSGGVGGAEESWMEGGNFPGKGEASDMAGTGGAIQQLDPEDPSQQLSNDKKPSRPPSSEAVTPAEPSEDSLTEAIKNCVPSPDKPPHQFALMIDAGSTGSRIHIYKFKYCLPPDAIGVDSFVPVEVLPTLESEIFKPIQPGLSSSTFSTPLDAAESLRPLLQAAMEAIPEEEQSCVPIAVKATAGLRLLGEKQSKAILEEVERWLREEWPFRVVQDGVVIMDGSDEGVYAWITINYLLGLIGPHSGKDSTAAVMDLGGASTQIVFEPTFSSSANEIAPGSHVYALNFSSHLHTLYQHSHLGYGLMQARRSVHHLVAFTYVFSSASKGKDKMISWESLTPATEIPNPCMVFGRKKKVKLDPPGRETVEVTFVGTAGQNGGARGFDACRRIVDVVMAKDALCEVEPCAFEGVYQPSLMDTFGKGAIYALSYFFDRITPLGLESPFTISQLRALTQDVCAGPSSLSSSATSSSSTKGWSRFSNSEEAMAELEGRPEYCLDLSFMYSLLSLGYELTDEREIRMGKKIAGVELGWSLGAAIAMLDGSGSVECAV